MSVCDISIVNIQQSFFFQTKFIVWLRNKREEITNESENVKAGHIDSKFLTRRPIFESSDSKIPFFLFSFSFSFLFFSFFFSGFI